MGRARRTLLAVYTLPARYAVAALVPPPRMQRHRYFGVLAPNSPLRFE